MTHYCENTHTHKEQHFVFPGWSHDLLIGPVTSVIAVWENKRSFVAEHRLLCQRERVGVRDREKCI